MTLIFLTGVFAAGSAWSQPLSADLDADSGARLPYLTRADLGEEGRRLADIFARDGQPGDPIAGPLAFAAYNVPVANALLDLHDGAVGSEHLTADIRELAILVASRETNYTLEWNGHLGLAQNVGVAANAIDVVLNNKPVTGLSDADATVIRFGRELLRERRMSSDTFADALEHFGEHGAMDLVAVMSTYAVSGFYAIAVDEHPPGQAMLPPLR
ncbi:MAG TPA: hypothetical protein VKQ06_14305 [Gammaproteobacteria bacterium]|nr:hypothetical protein [Gammaproteobacteria bacterium]